MALTKQNLAIPFSTELDLKTDPLQVAPTKLLALANAVYTKDKRLTKRNGFANLTQIPTSAQITTLTTFKENLTALGNSVLAYNESSETWIDRGRFQSVQLSTLSLARSSFNQNNVDAVVANGWVCSTWEEPSGSYFQISDAITSQVLLSRVLLRTTAKSVRVFALGNNFVVTYLATVSSTPTLQYIAIPFATLTPSSPVDISTQVKSINTAYDGVVFADFLYISWAGSDSGGSIRTTRIDSHLNAYVTKEVAASQADKMSLAFDVSMDQIWVNYYTVSTTSVHSLVYDTSLVLQLAPTLVDNSQTLNNLAASASNGIVSILCDIANDYSFASIPTDYISTLQCTISGTPSGPVILVRSVGLASKAFAVLGTTYFLGVFDSNFQPTYFLIDANGNTVAKLAYGNGGGYISGVVLPSVSVDGNVASIGYLFKDLLASTNATGNFYSQTGVNLVSLDLSPTNLINAELGNNLHIAGGFVWMYDGTLCSEHNFHLWPEQGDATPHTTGGHLIDQTYQYQIVYEWTDAQGNIHRSAPSIPTSIVVSGSGGNGSITLDIATLRLTYKNQVRIVIYRWSTAQQNFYQVTSIPTPLLNDPTVDSVSYTDELADSSILGNTLVYTTGGVLENIAYPAASTLCLYKSRLMVLSAEDRNTVWYSKQVIEGVPVEPSDLLTIFVAPTTGAQGSTGPTQVLSAMDDKFIMGKKDAWYYLTGDGPNNLGQQNDFSDPTYISSTVGSTNQVSLALTPAGIMGQSDKGVWLLGRDLSTQYIGAPVEDFNSKEITSAVVVPGTNQVRFCLNNSQALMYDYYFGRWGTFVNIPTISSTLYQGLHTYLTPTGLVRQERPDYYQDGSAPVLLSFTTAWINAAGVQGLERIYNMYLLATYLTPHRLSVNIAYNYQDGYSQSLIITPDNYAGIYGINPSIYGQGPVYGGIGSIEQWQVNFSTQKIQSIKINVQELYDPTPGAAPGPGLTFSGMDFTVGLKKGRPLLPSTRKTG